MTKILNAGDSTTSSDNPFFQDWDSANDSSPWGPLLQSQNGFAVLAFGDSDSQGNAGAAAATYGALAPRKTGPAAQSPMAEQAPTTSGFTIVPTWDASVLNSPDKALFEAAAETAIKKIESVISTNETIKIDFGYGVMPYDDSSTGIGGAESIGNSFAYTWTQVYNAAKAIESSATASAVQKAAAALLTSDNAKYAAVLNGDMMDITRAQALALGLPTSPLTTGTNGYDGWVALGSGPFDWAQNNPNQEDAVSALEHELSEVMGRTDDLGVSNGNAGEYTLLDMFHYGAATASASGGAAPGTAAGPLDEPFVAGYNANNVSYFSYNGSTITWQYDTPVEVSQDGEDVADWSTTNTSRPAVTDSFDGAGGNAIDPPISAPDWAEMAAIGYTERQSPRDDFDGFGKSDILISNTSGAVVVGEIGASGAEAYLRVATLGAQWTFRENGDFYGDNASAYLIENTSGQLDIGGVAGQSTSFTVIGSLGAQWNFVDAGDFLGVGHDQYLIESTGGQLDLGDASTGRAAYTVIGGISLQWKFEGAGDFLGDGHDQFLIQYSAGQVDLGDASTGHAVYTNIGLLGSNWKFEGVGDFLGKGYDQYLIESSAGRLEIGDASTGHALYTDIGALSPQLKFVGVGDYTTSGIAGAMVQNTNGALSIMTVVAGQAQYAAVGALGSQWTFHS